MSREFDVAVIGSGIGGLTCGALLARQGMRVAVLEQQARIGGCAQDFSRKGHTFDSSVHSVSMADSGFVCGLLTQLGIRESLEIVPNTCFARILSPVLRYSLAADVSSLTASLDRDFPREKKAVAALLSDMQMLFKSYKGGLKDGAVFSGTMGSAGEIERATRSYKEYIESFVKDDALRYLFSSIWPFGGSSPAFAPVYNAFIFIAHALEGSHYIKGGFGKLASALAGVITKCGGAVMTNWPVSGLRVDNHKRVCAARSATGEELAATTFVSNISPYRLHREFIPEGSRNRLWLRRLENLSPSVSAVCAYLGIRGDASDIVADNVTFWFASPDHDALYRRIRQGPRGDIDHLLIMRPPASRPDGAITLMHFVNQDPAASWKKEKMRLADAMIAKAATVLGDFTSRISLMETASPDTFERYTGNTGGALYGFENAPDLYRQSKLPFTTYLDNLFQVGHWTKAGGGIYNVMTSGHAVAKMIMRMT